MSRKGWLGCFLAWTALGLFMFSQAMTQKFFGRDPFPWWHHLTSWMIGVYVWFLLTPVVLWLGRRFPLERGRWLRRMAVHLPIAAIISLVQLAVESMLMYRLGLFPGIMSSYQATFVFLFVIAFHQGFMTYGTILGIQYAFAWYRRYQERNQEALRLQLRSSELQSQLVQAHLSALKMQLQPHFLFNTLNAITVLVRQHKGREAEEMLARLSDLLRCVLDDVETQEVPLSRELHYLQLYLAIEEVRFQDRLRIDIAVDPELLDAPVPHMILQPIVENAIRHGIGRSSSAGLIRISACRAGDSLEMTVEDDGPGLESANGGQSRGIGLANTRSRLEQLYGDAASLSLGNGETRGVKVAIVIPFRAPAGGPELTGAHAVHGARS
jgi:sensor histidine kinase YesM